MSSAILPQARAAIERVEARLAALGMSMEGELESVTGESVDTLVDAATDEPVENPSEEAMRLAVLWTWFTSFTGCDPGTTIDDLMVGPLAGNWASRAESLGVAWPPMFALELETPSSAEDGDDAMYTIRYVHTDCSVDPDIE
jgi:hypothetical protein